MAHVYGLVYLQWDGAWRQSGVPLWGSSEGVKTSHRENANAPCTGYGTGALTLPVLPGHPAPQGTWLPPCSGLSGPSPASPFSDEAVLLHVAPKGQGTGQQLVQSFCTGNAEASAEWGGGGTVEEAGLLEHGYPRVLGG